LARFLGKKVKAILFLVLLVIIGVVVLFAMSGGTVVALAPAVSTVGVSTPVNVQVTNPHGVRRVHAYIEQNGAQQTLLEQTAPSSRLMFWRKKEQPATFTFDAGKTKAPNLKEGKARIVVETVSNDLRGRKDSAEAEVNVVLTAPRVIPDDLQHYINQGGMELVTFTATGSFNESGVRVGPHTFRSFPLPGKGPEQRFAMFAYSWDLPQDVTPVVYARNLAGTEATGNFWFKLFPKGFRTRPIEADDKLLEKLVTSVDPTGQLAPGSDVVARFNKINTEIRAQNNKAISDLRLKTEEKILWNGPFVHWGKEEANFADVRDWMYKGTKLSRAAHLGFDLSDVANGPVSAANDGKVVFAENLGIYGNCVVLDHGYALQSIYGHMRQIDVKVGDVVKKGQSMGIAGQTGLAGGVHVHFSMQIDGVQVNPREWWDEHWIKDRILSKLDPSRITASMAASNPAATLRKAGKKRR
jgi:murein DD-endopeptidase MepM/ murein hydrolase activator NlpD